jgi:hypothetical protein
MKRRKKTATKVAPVLAQPASTLAPAPAPAPAPARAAASQTIGTLGISGHTTIGGSAGIVGSAGP